jgi:carbon storage regulator
MLVLTRKLNESVIIDGGIEIMVVAVRGNKVRLGFRAPADVSIQRAERVSDEVTRHGIHAHAELLAPAAVGAAWHSTSIAASTNSPTTPREHSHSERKAL